MESLIETYNLGDQLRRCRWTLVENRTTGGLAENDRRIIWRGALSTGSLRW
jgi:hypothetical protein